MYLNLCSRTILSLLLFESLKWHMCNNSKFDKRRPADLFGLPVLDDALFPGIHVFLVERKIVRPVREAFGRPLRVISLDPHDLLRVRLDAVTRTDTAAVRSLPRFSHFHLPCSGCDDIT